MSRLSNPGGNNSGGLPSGGTGGGGTGRGSGNRGGTGKLADYIFTLKSASGGELFGAVISGYDGEEWKSVVHTSQGETKLHTTEEPALRVRFLGRTLFQGSYEEFAAISDVGTNPRGSRRPEITLETTFNVEGVGLPFTGAEAALVMGGEVVVSWLPESAGTVEVSAAATSSALFTENSTTVTASISRGMARLPEDPAYTVAAVRRVGTSRAFGHVDVYREPSITNTGSYTLSLLLTKAWQGREVLVRAQAGSYSVDFSAEGATILEATDQFARVRITALQASITAAASDGQTTTTALTHHLRPVPATPQLSAMYTSGSDKVVEWYDRSVPDDITYLVQAGPSLRRAQKAVPTHTYDQRAAFTPRLGLNYMIVRAVDVLGRVSDPAEIEVIHGSPATRPVGRRTQALPTVHTAGSSSGKTLTLSDYVAIHTEDDETKGQAWQDVTADIFTTSNVSVEKSAGSWEKIDVFAEVSGPQPVLLRLRRDSFRPIWLGFVARISLTSPESANFSGAKAGEFGNAVDVNVKSFVGDDPALVVSDSDMNTLRIARPLAIEGHTLSPNVFDDGTPQYAIFEGSKGYGLFMLSDEPQDRSPSLPFMPEGTDSTSYAEEPGWSAFDPTDELGHEWNAAQTTSGEFFEISRKQLPRQIIEEAPENLAVRGLSVSASSATSARVTWRLENALTDADVRLPRSVTAERLTYNSGPDEFEATGFILAEARGVHDVELTGLPPASPIRVTVQNDAGDISKAIRLDPEPPAIEVTGQAIDGGEYQYTYVIDEGVEDWIDAFGNDYSAPQAQVLSTKVLDTHRLTLFGSPRVVPNNDLSATAESPEYVVEVPTVWNSPPDGFTISATVPVGERVNPESVPAPEFGTLAYADETTRMLPANLYEAGTIKAEPEGYLPFGMEGALEDYVELVFTDPRGEELGSIVSLERPAELGLSVRLTTDGSRSPVLHGVRIRYESA